jgi:hypothetical protein
MNVEDVYWQTTSYGYGCAKQAASNIACPATIIAYFLEVAQALACDAPKHHHR